MVLVLVPGLEQQLHLLVQVSIYTVLLECFTSIKYLRTLRLLINLQQ